MVVSSKKAKTTSGGTDARVSPHYFRVVRCPHVTEKSHSISESGQVVFKVLKSSSKAQIKSAVEVLFDLKIKAVNVMNMKGKEKVFRGRRGRRSDWKKAVITLQDKRQLKKLAMEAEF